MSKEVLLIFQDCPYCKPREAWGKRQTEFAKNNSVEVVPTSFKTPGAKGLIIKARSHGIETMPFFTDGKIFSTELSDFVKPNPQTPSEIAEEKVEPVSKKNTRKKATKVEVKKETDEVVSEEE